MALITCHFDSSLLGKSVAFQAIIPAGKEKNAKVFYLLHGLSDDYTAWTRYTSIERYANEAGIVVILPDAARSFYTDMVHGGPYYSFFTEEFFPYVSSLFSISTRREDTWIGGLSMGGYGAMKLALRNPERFSAVASLSGALHIARRLGHDPRWNEIADLVFGDPLAPIGTSEDLIHLAKTYASPEKLRMFITCGTEDFLYADNVAFVEALEHPNLLYTFSPAPGVHNWAFWDVQIQKAIQYLCTPL